MPALAILNLEQRLIREECEARRLRNERRYSPPEGACPYGCDGSGWRLVEDAELEQEPRPSEVVSGGQLYTFCECNGKLVLVNGHYEPKPVRLFQMS